MTLGVYSHAVGAADRLLAERLDGLLRPDQQPLGVPQISPRSLRHAHGSLLVVDGLDVKALQARLGHTRASGSLGNSARVLEKLLRGERDPT